MPPGFRQLFLDELDFLLEADAQGMLVRVLTEFLQLALQFDNRFLEIELMFHKSQAMRFPPHNQWGIPQMRKAGLASGPRGDEVYTPSPRRSEG